MSTLKTWSSLIKDIYFQKFMLNLAHWENQHMAFTQLACLERFLGLSQGWGKHMTLPQFRIINFKSLSLQDLKV